MSQRTSTSKDDGSYKRLGTKPPSLGKNTNSAIGSSTNKHDPGGVEVMQEDAANVQEQGTGRRRVRLLPGAGANNRR